MGSNISKVYGTARKLAVEHTKLKENIAFLDKKVQTKIKLIEELKKKCKTSIKNSLSRSNKTRTFNPTLNTIPNTKTRNSKSRRFRSKSHND
jgi:hypothetical protein